MEVKEDEERLSVFSSASAELQLGGLVLPEWRATGKYMFLGMNEEKKSQKVILHCSNLLRKIWSTSFHQSVL